MKDLSLIIRCYNEASHLQESLRQLDLTLKSMTYSYEIIFVDDCSQDQTRSIIEGFIKTQTQICKTIFHEKNLGHGQTLFSGAAQAEAKVIGYIDIDLEVSSVYIPQMLNALLKENYQIATAYRHYPNQMNLNALCRKILSLGYRLLYRIFIGLPLYDTETGYKFFIKEVFFDLTKKVQNKGWFWDTEMMTAAYLMSFRIKEIPCLFLRRADKKTSIKVINYTLRHFKELVLFRQKVLQMQKALKSQL